ncbi:Hypothetical protein, partial CDS, partial [Neorhizobium galegae bv. orientalis]
MLLFPGIAEPAFGEEAAFVE